MSSTGVQHHAQARSASVALCLGAPVLAAEVGGVKLDDKARSAGRSSCSTAPAMRTKMMFKVYVGSLYLPAKATDLAGVLAKGPRRIQINLLRNLTADQLRRRAGRRPQGQQFDRGDGRGQGADRPDGVDHEGFREVKEKDVVTLDFVDDATKIGLNGADKGVIPGEAFNKALTRIWLGDKPAQADLKKAMLGG